MGEAGNPSCPQLIEMSEQTKKYPTIIEGKNAVGTMLRNLNIEIEGRAGHIQLGKFAHYYFINVKTKKKYWIKKVHQPFYTFSKQFPEHAGVGETLDADVFKLLNENDEIFFVYDDAIYSVEYSVFNEHLRDRENWADNNITTYSIPIKLLERFD